MDVLFDHGKPMRDRGVQTSKGQSTHPAAGRGTVGKWTRVRIPLGGQAAGSVIREIVVAFDAREDGPFEAYFDDIRIESSLAEGAVAQVNITPESVSISRRTGVTLSVEGGLPVGRDGVPIRYTTDGTNPTAGSALYAGPIRPDGPGLWEVRCVAEIDGVPGKLVSGRLFDVR